MFVWEGTNALSRCIQPKHSMQSTPTDPEFVGLDFERLATTYLPLYVHTQIDKYTRTHIHTRNQAQQEPPTSYTHNEITQKLRSQVVAFLRRVTTLLRRGGACECVCV